MANRQESNSSYYEMAKEIAKVEKDLGFERWVRIEIAMETTRTEHGTENKRMAFYDLPVWVYQRREWVIRWRAARIQCQHPRNQVRTFSDYYRRMNGNDLGMQQDIDKFISSKAAVTRQRNNLERYLAERRQDMFFDEARPNAAGCEGEAGRKGTAGERGRAETHPEGKRNTRKDKKQHKTWERSSRTQEPGS